MMKMNKWTMALAAAGVVSLSSVAQAQEAAGGAEALAASTTVSGYVSTSYTSTSDAHARTFRSNEDIDSFALDVVSLSISNGALGTEAGSAAYNLELWVGPAASNIDTADGASADGDQVALMEANIELLASLGEQDVKLTVGQFGTTVGAETYSYADNTFHGRSFGFAIEPTHHTGIKAETKLGGIDVTLGLANDTTSNQTNDGEGSHAILVGAQHTLGDSMGWLGGTKLTYGGVLDAGDDNAESTNHYFGLTKEIATNLTYSLAWDIQEVDGRDGDSNVVGHYLSYPLGGGTLNVRYEHGNLNLATPSTATGTNADGLESLTIGYNYPIWTGVTSRVEFRSDDWDGKANSAESVALSLVYNF